MLSCAYFKADFGKIADLCSLSKLKGEHGTAKAFDVMHFLPITLLFFTLLIE